jgi:ribosome-interacting GTPase 1
VLEKELEGVGIRLNKSPPNIVVRKKDKGGISVTNVSVTILSPKARLPLTSSLSQTVPLTQIDADVVKAVCNEYRIASADIAFRSDATVDDLIE